ncbi:MAG: hypothetical protein AAF218_11310 [Pseudomonadota bacterium]
MWTRLAALAIAASPAAACTVPVCQVDPDTLALPRLIDFEGLQAGQGPGHPLHGVLDLDGASFGKFFAGQNLSNIGEYDTVVGAAAFPLTLQEAPKPRTKSLVWVDGNTILNGFGPQGFPRRKGQGEGALAIHFDLPQPALAFDIRGGEAGIATVQFLDAGGSEIARLRLQGIGEGPVAFQRGDRAPDIAGVVITNEDPQGIAIDNVRFGQPPNLG